MTIGVLLPRSTYYSAIALDIIQGLKLGCSKLPFKSMKIISENIGFGADKQRCYSAAENLIFNHEVDVIVGYIGQRMAQLLKPLLLASNKLLLVLDAGAHLPQEYAECPNIIYISLHNALGASLSAALAAKDGYTTGGMVTGYYDAGYLHTFALCNGFQRAGGTIVFNHATGYTMQDFTMQPLDNQLSKHKDSALLSIFSGDYVQWYFNELRRVFGAVNLPVYLQPFALEERVLSETAFPGHAIKGVTSWSSTLDNEANIAFTKTMELAGIPPSIFSLLAWEAATVLFCLEEAIAGKRAAIATIIEILEDFEFEGPRGSIRFHAPTYTFVSPMYVSTIEAAANGACKLVLGEGIPDIEDHLQQLHEQPIGESISGWYNSYTCT